MTVRSRWKKFLPEPGTKVKVILDAGKDWQREHILIYEGFVLAQGLTPDQVKFKTEYGTCIILNFRDIDLWEY